MMPSTKVSWSGILAALALFLIPGFGLYLPNGLVVVLSVYTLASLLESLKTRRWPRLTGIFIWLLPALATWAAISANWALNANLALQGATQIAGLAVITVLLLSRSTAMAPKDQDRAVKAYLFGVMVATVMLLVDSATNMRLVGWFRAYDITDPLQFELAQRSLNRGIALLGLYMPITLLLAWRCSCRYWRWPGLASALIAAILCLSWGKDAVLLSFLAAGLFGALALLPNRSGRMLLVAGFTMILFASPLVAGLLPSSPQTIWEEFRDWPPSLQHRMFIWNFTSGKITEHPIRGWGMNSAKIIPGGDKDYSVGSGQGELQWRALPLHPHNAILQWWLELGLIGTLLAGGMVIATILAIWRMHERITRVTAAACLGSAMTISLLSYGAWQSWWLAGIIIVAWLFKFLAPLDQA